MNNETLIETVEELFRRSDVRVHEIFSKIIALEVEKPE